MRLWPRKREKTAVGSVQLRETGRHPFGMLDGYVPLRRGDLEVYRGIREAIPVVDAAIVKLVRLCSGVAVKCGDERAQKELERFLRTVPVGRGQRGIQSFLDQYLDSLFVCGRAIGEIVPEQGGGGIAALLCGDPGRLEILEGESPLDMTICVRDGDGAVRELPRQELLLFTPFQPEAGNPYGVSLLRSMPFLAEILLKIFQTTGTNWERMGNARYAVICRDGENGTAAERCGTVAREWAAAMQESRGGAVRDFVTTGDVDIKVIGADNPVLDSETPVRQILEQLVAKTGVPPFLLGLSWSSTERMSSQQADILTSEITAIRRTVEPVVERICELWLRMHGYDDGVAVEWADINLQDEVDEAKALLYRSQARALQEEGEEST